MEFVRRDPNNMEYFLRVVLIGTSRKTRIEKATLSGDVAAMNSFTQIIPPTPWIDTLGEDFEMWTGAGFLMGVITAVTILAWI